MSDELVKHLDELVSSAPSSGVREGMLRAAEIGYGGLWDLREAEENVRQLTSALTALMATSKAPCMECGIEQTDEWGNAKKVLQTITRAADQVNAEEKKNG